MTHLSLQGILWFFLYFIWTQDWLMPEALRQSWAHTSTWRQLSSAPNGKCLLLLLAGFYVLFYCIVQSLEGVFVLSYANCQAVFLPSIWPPQLASIRGATHSHCMLSPAKQFLNKKTFVPIEDIITFQNKMMRQSNDESTLNQLIGSNYSYMTFVAFWTSPPENAPSAFCCTTD